MADRRVTGTGKDDDGDIVSLCNPRQSWSPRSSRDAIKDIEDERHTYYVLMKSGSKSQIHVVDGPTRKYLRTNWDKTERNNLDDLPDC
jgi:Protein of unknown function (DUF3892)